MKYNKKMFLDYASAFDYTEDFYNNAEENHGKPITWEQAIKENDEFMKSMNCWSLKDFQKWFDFRKFEIEEYKKGGSRPQARTTGHKPQAVFHVKKKNKGGSRPHAPLCPRHFVR